MTRRRWIADTWIIENTRPTSATLVGDQAAHLARVLRVQPGQIFDVVAGGFLHRAEVSTVSPDAVTFRMHEELEHDTALPLHLYLAVFKFDHLEWAIEKATELGIARITPILARRTEKHLALAAVKRVERWRRIAHEAAQQSRRTTVPLIGNPTPLKPLLEQEKAPVRILLSESEQNTTLSAALKASILMSPETSPRMEVQIDTSLAIGPEGGWTPEEMTLFHGHGWKPVTLGPRILRAETAALAAIAIAGTYFN